MKHLMKHVGTAVAVAVLLWGVAGPAYADLVQNGSFQTGDFTDWSVTGNTGFTGVDLGNGPTGQNTAYLGPVGSQGFLMQQNLATNVGDSYSFSFYLYSDGGTPNNFSAAFAGQTV